MVNFFAVLIAAVAQVVVGALWYSPAMFMNKWLRFAEIDKKKIKRMQKNATRSYILGFLSSLVVAYVLAIFIHYTYAETALEGIVTAFWIWLGFIMTVTLGGFLWEGKRIELWVLNGGYWLVSLGIMGAILAAWPS